MQRQRRRKNDVEMSWAPQLIHGHSSHFYLVIDTDMAIWQFPIQTLQLPQLLVSTEMPCLKVLAASRVS